MYAIRSYYVAGNFADEFDQQERMELDLDDKSRKALKELTDALNSQEEPQDIQNRNNFV